MPSVPQCLSALVCLGALGALYAPVMLQDQLHTSVELTQQMQTINLIDASVQSARWVSSLASCIVPGWLVGWPVEAAMSHLLIDCQPAARGVWREKWVVPLLMCF